MMIKPFIFGPMQTNCYLLADDLAGVAAVIDPDIRTDEEETVFTREIGRRGLSLQYIINTHHHSDHISGNRRLKERYSARILIHESDAPYLTEPWRWWQKTVEVDPGHHCPVCDHQGNYLNVFPEQGKAVLGCQACGFQLDIYSSPPADHTLGHGEVIKIGELVLRIMHTPGHTAGSICLWAEKEEVLFSGDTLFSLAVGRTDMIDGSTEDMVRSVRNLMVLPDEVIVYPGHGEQTTIGRERRGNPFITNG